ncbi:hypothetical protein EMCG_02783 [[Emmonsia] crescens]|uniref:Uncharacterized protein n=1 Tax=[Emmonsia] crescens TaxID=73230 RepID=A0A0G2J128_9EURO|nr:hypothetical protein EMCG_02783 [Emmonsia crescens UAMH 3008]
MAFSISPDLRRAIHTAAHQALNKVPFTKGFQSPLLSSLSIGIIIKILLAGYGASDIPTSS